MTQYISNTAAQDALDAILGLLDAGGAGSLKIYAGTVPADADASIGAATLLATLALSSTAFGDATDANPGATATADTITSANAAATGTATFFRLVNNAGTAVYQGTVTATGGGGNLELITTSITSGQPVQVSSLVATLSESHS